MMDMDTRGVRWQSVNTAGRTNTRRRKPKKKPEDLRGSEGRRLRQLLICLVLFAVVFVGRGLPGGQLDTLRQTLGAWVQRDTDFKAVFAQFGQSMSEGQSVKESVGLLWSQLFEGESVSPATPDPSSALPQGEVPPAAILPEQETQEVPAQEGASTPAPEVVAAQPPAVPDNLVSGTIATPVMGVVTSPFGYRTHPLDGEWKQHDGLDIMANEGTNIGAFADGTVDFIGESPSYGLYLQLKHANGITSFYAHCSKILVKTGQSVKAGEPVALVGATGEVTGAHLHLELKQNGTRIDPALYIETKAS